METYAKVTLQIDTYARVTWQIEAYARATWQTPPSVLNIGRDTRTEDLMPGYVAFVMVLGDALKRPLILNGIRDWIQAIVLRRTDLYSLIPRLRGINVNMRVYMIPMLPSDLLVVFSGLYFKY